MALKSHPENSPEGKQAKADAQSADSSLAEVQKMVEKEQAQGFRGVETDPTPNENYTVKGVLAGDPTPETDQEHYEKVRQHQLGLTRVVNGVSER